MNGFVPSLLETGVVIERDHLLHYIIVEKNQPMLWKLDIIDRPSGFDSSDLYLHLVFLNQLELVRRQSENKSLLTGVVVDDVLRRNQIRDDLAERVQNLNKAHGTLVRRGGRLLQVQANNVEVVLAMIAFQELLVSNLLFKIAGTHTLFEFLHLVLLHQQLLLL